MERVITGYSVSLFLVTHTFFLLTPPAPEAGLTSLSLGEGTERHRSNMPKEGIPCSSMPWNVIEWDHIPYLISMAPLYAISSCLTMFFSVDFIHFLEWWILWQGLNTWYFFCLEWFLILLRNILPGISSRYCHLLKAAFFFLMVRKDHVPYAMLNMTLSIWL